ncbi:hypothetical protein ES703_19525 [subsurface metagenome]
MPVECPYIDTCGNEITEAIFKTFCQVPAYVQCSIYCATIIRNQIDRKTPREWKKEKKGAD